MDEPHSDSNSVTFDMSMFESRLRDMVSYHIAVVGVSDEDLREHINERYGDMMADHGGAGSISLSNVRRVSAAYLAAFGELLQAFDGTGIDMSGFVEKLAATSQAAARILTARDVTCDCDSCRRERGEVLVGDEDYPQA